SRHRRRDRGSRKARDRKSWPHVLSPEGRGGKWRRQMIGAILSGDLPRSRVLSVALAALLATLALAPFLFSGAQAINTAAKICVFIVLVASYDLLLGYTGIVSFAHTMFDGLGGYGVGLALYGWGATWTSAFAGLAVALLAGVALAFLIGLFSLRVRAIFFAMVTLAVASAFAILAAQLSDITGGEDGRSFRVPELLRPGCASSTRRSAGCCRRSARTTSAPRLWATARSTTARPPTAWPPPWPCWRARSTRCGCAIPGRTPRCRSPSCSTSC